jgi:hypothetical protein
MKKLFGLMMVLMLLLGALAQGDEDALPADGEDTEFTEDAGAAEGIEVTEGTEVTESTQVTEEAMEEPRRGGGGYYGGGGYGRNY